MGTFRQRVLVGHSVGGYYTVEILLDRHPPYLTLLYLAILSVSHLCSTGESAIQNMHDTVYSSTFCMMRLPSVCYHINYYTLGLHNATEHVRTKKTTKHEPVPAHRENVKGLSSSPPPARPARTTAAPLWDIMRTGLPAAEPHDNVLGEHLCR